MIAARIGSTVFRMGPEIKARIAEALSRPTPLRPEDVASMLDAELRRESRRVARATHGRLGPRSRARLVACFERAFLAEFGIGVRS